LNKDSDLIERRIERKILLEYPRHLQSF